MRNMKLKGFLIGACIGIVAVLRLWLLPPVNPSMTTILLLCPTSILAFAYQGGSVWLSMFFFVIELGGNIFLYGAAGLLIAAGVEKFKRPKAVS
jgi:hypothetical protein